MDKLRLYAVQKDKTVTAIIEDLLDTLPELNADSVTAPSCASHSSHT